MEIKVILSIPVTVSFLECRRWLDSVCDLCVCSWPSRLPTALGPASTHAPVVALLYVATVPHIGRHSLNTARLSFLWPMLPAFKRIILCLRVTLHRPLYLPLYGSDLSTLRVVSPVWCHLAILKAAHTLALLAPTVCGLKAPNLTSAPWLCFLACFPTSTLSLSQSQLLPVSFKP